MPGFESVPFGPPTVGDWCPRCNLPSVCSQVYVMLSGNTEVRRYLLHICDDCGAWNARQIPIPLASP